MQYQIYDGLHYISIVQSMGSYVRLRNMPNARYAITYTLATAEKINGILNAKGIPSQVIPYVKTWKSNNQTFNHKNQINDIFTDNQ